jgi:hypothetical protein
VEAAGRPGKNLHGHEDGLWLLRRRPAYLSLGRRGVSGRRQASWLWLTAYFVVLTMAALSVANGLSLVTKVAPARAVSMMGPVAAPASPATFSPATSTASGRAWPVRSSDDRVHPALAGLAFWRSCGR